MVEDRITDGDRIATLLRAEIEGRETAGLDRLSIVESTADRSLLSADDGPAVVDTDERILATLEPTPDGLDLRFQTGDHPRNVESLVGKLAGTGPLKVDVRRDQVLVTVPTAAAVKQAVDLLVAASEH